MADCPHRVVVPSAGNRDEGKCAACGKAMVRKRQWQFAGYGLAQPLT